MRILDLATGSGDLALALRSECPGALIVAADFCLPMLMQAQHKGVTHLLAADGLQLPFGDAAVDAVTIAFGLRNMESWPRALAEMRRVIRPGGHLLVLDFAVPPPPLVWFYRPYLHHILPRIAAFLTREQSAYEYLGASIEQFPSGAAMQRLMEEAGFDQTTCEPLSGGIVALYTARRAHSAMAEH